MYHPNSHTTPDLAYVSDLRRTNYQLMQIVFNSPPPPDWVPITLSHGETTFVFGLGKTMMVTCDSPVYRFEDVMGLGFTHRTWGSIPYPFRLATKEEMTKFKKNRIHLLQSKIDNIENGTLKYLKSELVKIQNIL